MIYKLLNMRESNTIFVEISKVCKTKSETEDTSSRNLSNNLSLNLQISIDSVFIFCALSSESENFLCVRTSEATEIISAWLLMYNWKTICLVSSFQNGQKTKRRGDRSPM